MGKEARARRLGWLEWARLGTMMGGLALSAALGLRSQVGGEQIEILARGWWLFQGQVWIPFGLPTSGGGVSPGGLTGLLAALPLYLWQDYRAVVLFIGLLHLGSYLLLDAALRRALPPGGRLVFAVLYWLNPTRLYLSGIVWNPSFMLLFAAVHLWSSLHLARRPTFWVTLAHVLAASLAVQIHMSGVLLAGGSLALLLFRRVRLNWPAVAAGAAITALSLLPWALEVARHPELFPVGGRPDSRSVPVLHPVAGGIGHWLRSASFYASDKVTRLIPDSLMRLGLSRTAVEGLQRGLRLLLISTVLLSVAAHVWLLRRRVRSFRRKRPLSGSSTRHAALAYSLCMLAGAIPIFAASPTSMMWWQISILMPAAQIPVSIWWGLALRSRRRRAARLTLAGHILAGSLTGCLLLAGGVMFHCQSPYGRAFRLRASSPALTGLNVAASCEMRIDPRHGWWNPILESPPRIVPRVP